MPTDLFFNRDAEQSKPSQNDSETLSEKAERCRRLAAGISDRQAAEVLRTMAIQYALDAARHQS